MKRGTKISLNKLFHTKQCYGWAWHVKGRQYAWHNDNDLGLTDLADIEDLGIRETFLRKVKIGYRKYIYILRNSWGITEEDESTTTLTTLKALLKDCHRNKMTQHEKMLANRYW